MPRKSLLAHGSCACLLLLLTLIACSGRSGSLSISVPSSAKIHHVVVIFQENRTPDNLFHGLPGADIADSGINSHGETITLQPIGLATTYDLNHGRPGFELQYDNGKMDGADILGPYCDCNPGGGNCKKSGASCGVADAQFKYVDPGQVVPYFQLAERYTFGDRMFQTNEGPSFPAHQYIISGTSAPSVGGLYGDYFVSENPAPNGQTGCALAAADQKVLMVDPAGVESASIFPCFEHPTLIDLLDKAGISWRYYAPSAGSIWTGPNAIKHLSTGPDWSNVIIPQSQVLTDIAAGKLAQVAWVMPDGAQSDHALVNDGSGPSWVASIVNAIGNSPYWNDTAIIITWDDWGGWYDHVAPSIYNSYEYGFRVPLIVVSPYARKAYVSHVTHDFGSILKFIEEVFTLPSLGYADSRADDLADCFDFAQSVTPYSPVTSEHSAKYFIERGMREPPIDPDDD